jgi:hypothetical protein
MVVGLAEPSGVLSMRSSSSLSLPSVPPSGLSACEVRRFPEFSAEAFTARPTAPTYEELWGHGRQNARDDWSRDPLQAPWFSPILAAILAIVLGSMSLVGLKEQIVRVLPASSALYAAAGLPVNLRGLEFRGVKSIVSEANTQRLLHVKGEIANLRSGLNPIPPIELVVEGTDGRPLYRWTAKASKPKLGANETIAFETRLVAPPEAGRDVKVRFAQAN